MVPMARSDVIGPTEARYYTFVSADKSKSVKVIVSASEIWSAKRQVFRRCEADGYVDQTPIPKQIYMDGRLRDALSTFFSISVHNRVAKLLGPGYTYEELTDQRYWRP